MVKKCLMKSKSLTFI